MSFDAEEVSSRRTLGATPAHHPDGHAGRAHRLHALWRTGYPSCEHADRRHRSARLCVGRRQLQPERTRGRCAGSRGDLLAQARRPTTGDSTPSSAQHDCHRGGPARGGHGLSAADSRPISAASRKLFRSCSPGRARHHRRVGDRLRQGACPGDSSCASYEYNDAIEAPPEGRDPVEYFLYDIRQGYCDYYATSMALMLRSLGVPARVVSGYAEGFYNDETFESTRSQNATRTPGWRSTSPATVGSSSSRPPAKRQLNRPSGLDDASNPFEDSAAAAAEQRLACRDRAAMKC